MSFTTQEQLWRALFYEPYQLMELVWNVINRMETNISPTELYARLCSAQEHWMSYRAAHSPEHQIGSIVSEDGPSRAFMADEIALFERLLHHVKESMAITPA